MTSPTQARRSTTNRMLGGVCGGLAEYTRTDPLLWRLGFVALGLAGPGIIAYALLWILMPESGSDAARDGSRPLDGLMDRLRYGNAGAPPPPAPTPPAPAPPAGTAAQGPNGSAAG
jgi:phage shock protein PspC (stress-responsive transcriptional regulator)